MTSSHIFDFSVTFFFSPKNSKVSLIMESFQWPCYLQSISGHWLNAGKLSSWLRIQSSYR